MKAVTLVGVAFCASVFSVPDLKPIPSDDLLRDVGSGIGATTAPASAYYFCEEWGNPRWQLTLTLVARDSGLTDQKNLSAFDLQEECQQHRSLLEQSKATIDQFAEIFVCRQSASNWKIRIFALTSQTPLISEIGFKEGIFPDFSACAVETSRLNGVRQKDPSANASG